MTAAQVVAIGQCRRERPALDEWWVRYVKAWLKAEGLTPDELEAGQ